MSDFFGGSNYKDLSAKLTEYGSDSAIEAIILNYNTPGGVSAGVNELAQQIYELRKFKTVISVVDSMAASAGYWLASQSEKLFASPSSSLGSIGVYMIHADLTRSLQKKGVKIQVIRAGENKIAANPFEPLPDGARAKLQASVNSVYTDFISDIARGRGISVERVLANYGKGEMFNANDAVRFGLADGVATVSQVISDLGFRAGPEMQYSPSRRERQQQQQRPSFASISTTTTAAVSAVADPIPYMRGEVSKLKAVLSEIASASRHAGGNPETDPKYRRIKSSIAELESQIERLERAKAQSNNSSNSAANRMLDSVEEMNRRFRNLSNRK